MPETVRPEEIAACLAEQAPFGTLPGLVLESVIRHGVARHYTAGDRLYEAHEVPRAFCVVVRGRFRRLPGSAAPGEPSVDGASPFSLPGGGEVRPEPAAAAGEAVLGRGAAPDVLAFLGEMPSGAALVAETDGVMFELRREVLAALYKRHPELAAELLAETASRACRAETLLATERRRASRDRALAFLAQMLQSHGEEFTLPVGAEAAADCPGAPPGMLRATLVELAGRGVVQLSGTGERTVLVLAPQVLRALAAG